MGDAPKPPDDWSTAAVVERLRRAARPGQPVTAHIFLHEKAAAGGLSDVASRLVERAKAQGKGGALAANIGAISRLAKSFSLTADPSTIEAVASMPEVKAILPSEIEDIYPAPVRKEKVELHPPRRPRAKKNGRA
jgi:hypothetical protein